jgi:hypothetical protein
MRFAWDALDYDAAEVDGERRVAAGEHDDFDGVGGARHRHGGIPGGHLHLRHPWKMISGEAASGHQKVKQ